jgi:hypothetical protein
METGIAIIVLLAVVALVVVLPLTRGGRGARAAHDRRAELEAAKEAKYREIRDAELDFRMGKLSEDDWRAADRELRAQAIEILHELDNLQPSIKYDVPT